MHLPLQRRDTLAARTLRAIFGAAAVASILTGATGCDKQDDASVAVKQTSLAAKPQTLFFVFGDAADPRVLPLATLADGKITPITLDDIGWRDFDRLYFPPGARLSMHHDGLPKGDAVVRRGMWVGNDALYKLPNCQALRPLAAVTLDSAPPADVMLEMLATSDPLLPPPKRAPATASDVDSARALATRVGQHEGLTNSARAELDEVVKAITTSATPHPTLVASFMERGSGLNGVVRHVFLIGDYDEVTHAYMQSYVHVPADSLREYRRFIDHADLTGDGVDEIVLEGWQKQGDSYLMFLQYRESHWREMARSATRWCADPKKS